MTATLNNNDDLGFDWRSKGLCNASDADLHYADVQELIEEYDYSEAEAEQFVAEATALAKAVCEECPVRRHCLASAIANDEEWGIWGGLTTSERTQFVKTGRWTVMKQQRGLPTERTAQHGPDRLHPHGSVNARYQLRLARAHACLEKLRDLPACWTHTNGQYGTHGRDQFIALFELIVRYPDRPNIELVRETGHTSDGWFSDMMTNCRKALGVE